jgi:hypothetical protein
MRTRWKVGLAVAAVFGALAAVAFAAPRLIDVEAYKPALVDAVRGATGRELVIDGPMKLTLFPVPGIGAGQVHFSNAVGAKGAQMVDVRWVAVTPSWSALLQGHIAVGTLTLYRPSIVLETDAEGRPNWDFAPGAGAKQAAGAPSAGFHLAIGRLRIVSGSVVYTDPHNNKHIAAEDVRASASVTSFDGPFTISGRATVNDIPLKLEIDFGPPTDKGHETSLSLAFSSGKLEFTGSLSEFNPNASVNGHLTVETGLLADFIGSLFNAIGSAPPAFDTSMIGRFAFDGGIDIAADRFAVSDFSLSLGHDQASGTLELDEKPAPTLKGSLKLAKLDLDRWLAFVAKSELSALAPAAKASLLPAAFDLSVALDVAAVVYRGEAITKLSTALEVAKGVITMPRLSAVLPGEMTVQAAAPGAFSLAGAKLGETLAWLGVDIEGVPKDRLQTLQVSAAMATKPDGMALSDLKFLLDGVPGTGSASLTLGASIAASAQLAMDRFDLDAYMPKAAAAGASVVPATPAATLPLPAVALQGKVGELTYRGEVLKGVEADAELQGNMLKLKRVAVADLLGAKLQLQGTVADFGTAPRYNLAFNVSAPDVDRLLDYARLPEFRNGKIGAATASGNVTGTLTAATLNGVEVEFLGAEARATGSLALGDSADFDFTNFSLQSQDLSRLASTASGRTMSGIGSVSASGHFKGNVERAAFSGDLTLLGVAMNGTFDATLGERPKITASVTVPGGLDVGKWFAAPAAADGVGNAKSPIDLSPLRALDAVLSLKAPALSFASLKLENAGLEATLSNGVVKLAQLAGQFYGGAVAFTGTVDATGQALALDLAGDMRGVGLADMLRGMVGNNSLGNADLTVALDGKLDATGIRLAGKGTTTEEILNALSGGAELAGFVNPAVVKGSQSLAQFATSIGGIFSDEMAFNSLVLQSFIGRQSTLAGQLQLQGRTFSTQNETVKGQNATALVDSRTDVQAGTTDTTVRVSSGSDQYVTTIKGPLAAPVMSTVRSNN